MADIKNQNEINKNAQGTSKVVNESSKGTLNGRSKGASNEQMIEIKKGFFAALKDKISALSDSNLLFLITVVVFVLMYLGAMLFQGGGFLRPQTLFNILNTNAALIIVSLGMSIVMISGGIDISVGGVMGLITMVCAVYIEKQGGSIFMSALIAIAIGLTFGLVQGVLVAYFEIQPFIVTLAGMFFARGMTTIVSKEPFNVTEPGFVAVKDTQITIPFLGYYTKAGRFVPAYVEIGTLVAILLVVVAALLLKFTRLGRNFYAVGGNRQSALMLGINVKRTTFISHVISGILAGVGGYVYFVHCGSGAVTNASGAEMDAIASSIIGGTMLTGGVGNIVGTLFGVVSLNTIKTIVAFAGLDEAWWMGITTAAMLCLFLVVQSIVIKRKKTKK